MVVLVRIDLPNSLLLPAATIASALAALRSSPHAQRRLRAHLLIALAAVAPITIAALHAMLMAPPPPAPPLDAPAERSMIALDSAAAAGAGTPAVQII